MEQEPNGMKIEDIQAALRWARGDATLTDVTLEYRSRGSVRGLAGTSVYILLARSLREAFKRGMVEEAQH